MRILITGGLGLIGSEIAWTLSDTHHVIVVDDGRSAVAHDTDAAELYDCAVELLPDVGDLDCVIHCAAPVGPVGILGRRVIDEMTSATRSAIDLATVNKASLVALSSSEVYGTINPTGSLVVPDDWSHRTEYAVGKIVTEQLVRRHYAETGLPTCLIRPWNCTGPRQSAAAGFVFPRMAAQAVADEPITVYQPGHQRRAFMAVSDLAHIVAELIGESEETYWTARPLDAATPGNEVAMLDLALMFGQSVQVVDPTDEHGATFREAAAGSKLPPRSPALPGWTLLETMVERAMQAARVTEALSV